MTKRNKGKRWASRTNKPRRCSIVRMWVRYRITTPHKS